MKDVVSFMTGCLWDENQTRSRKWPALQHLVADWSHDEFSKFIAAYAAALEERFTGTPAVVAYISSVFRNLRTHSAVRAMFSAVYNRHVRLPSHLEAGYKTVRARHKILQRGQAASEYQVSEQIRMTPLEKFGDDITLAMCAEDLAHGDDDPDSHEYSVQAYSKLRDFERWFLMLVAEVILDAQKGFISLAAIVALFEECHYLDGAPRCQFVRHDVKKTAFSMRPPVICHWLMGHLPLVAVTVGSLKDKSIMSSQVLLAARPKYPSLVLPLLRSVLEYSRAASAGDKVLDRLRALPLGAYLGALETRKSRRVLRGMVTQLTSPKFVAKYFKWNKHSAEGAAEELTQANLMDTLLQRQLEAVGYHAEVSKNKRQSLRQAARKVVGLDAFMAGKSMAQERRHSLLEKFKCCLGGHIEDIVNMSGQVGPAAHRRRRNVTQQVASSMGKGDGGQLQFIARSLRYRVCCRTGESIIMSRACVARAMHPKRKNSRQARAHKVLADIRCTRVRKDDHDEHTESHYGHAMWKLAMDKAYADSCTAKTSADDHAKVKPAIARSTSNGNKVFMTNTCPKRAPSKDCNKQQKNGNLVIDSMVWLTTDIEANKKRLAGKLPPLKRRRGTALISRNGGVPFAVLQIEHFSPSTPPQKANNYLQLCDKYGHLFNRCHHWLFTDKGPDRNMEYDEVKMVWARALMMRNWCSVSMVTHAGGDSPYNVGAERLNGAETRAMQGVPIAANPLGEVVGPDGEVLRTMVQANLEFELDELKSRLQRGQFCGFPINVEKAPYMSCMCDPSTLDGAESCEWKACKEPPFTKVWRTHVRAYLKAGIRTKKNWQPEEERVEFGKLYAFIRSPTHVRTGKYIVQLFGCGDECPFGCLERQSLARCDCEHSNCGLDFVPCPTPVPATGDRAGSGSYEAYSDMVANLSPARESDHMDTDRYQPFYVLDQYIWRQGRQVTNASVARFVKDEMEGVIAVALAQAYVTKRLAQLAKRRNPTRLKRNCEKLEHLAIDWYGEGRTQGQQAGGVGEDTKSVYAIYGGHSKYWLAEQWGHRRKFEGLWWVKVRWLQPVARGDAGEVLFMYQYVDEDSEWKDPRTFLNTGKQLKLTRAHNGWWVLKYSKHQALTLESQQSQQEIEQNSAGNADSGDGGSSEAGDIESCQSCGEVDYGADNPMLLCDNCDLGWHISCLSYELSSRFDMTLDTWHCPDCKEDMEIEDNTEAAVSSDESSDEDNF